MFQKDHVFTQVNGRSKNEILQYISEKAEDLQITNNQAGLLADLLTREDEVSTGLSKASPFHIQKKLRCTNGFTSFFFRT
ncbi:hypothetical protein BsIDN1_04210 [Bacillus safensis]|uniref:PTS EIIA type-2 domain-containing protein n=1 Tax=Bacillus safensis TaxID=561879 RepID=A0A5S9M0Z4_BACIA|nr:hypothetical protein BsIDN1_04210 [Bacillus safensis]